MKGTSINPSFFVLYLKVTPVANMFDCLYMLIYTVLILSTDLSETNSYFAGCIKIPKEITQYYPVLLSNAIITQLG